MAFSRVLAEGKARTSGSIRCFSLRVAEGKTQPRVGFAVVRSVRNAALRNRAKRLMREAYRLHMPRLFADGVYGVSEIVLLYLDDNKDHLRYPSVEREVVTLLKNLRERK